MGLWGRIVKKVDFAVKRAQLSLLPLGEDKIVIDCGANVGDVAVRFAKRGATVYAFEPNPAAFAILSERMKPFPRVHCIPKGVMAKDGTMRLYLHAEAASDPVKWSVGSSVISAKKNVDAGSYVDVAMVDLASFIRGLGKRIAVLKIDVEGAEYGILKSLIETGVIDSADIVLVETHEHKIPEIAEEAAVVRAEVKKRGINNVRFDWI